MPDTGEQSRATVVFHHPPGAIPDILSGDTQDVLPNVEYYRATTTHGESAYVSSADDFRTVVRYVMDNAARIPKDVEVSAVPESAIADEIVDMRFAMSMKQRGATEPNGTFETVMAMSTDLESMAIGDSVSTESTEGDSNIDPDVWFEQEQETDSDGDTLVDSAAEHTDSEEDTEIAGTSDDHAVSSDDANVDKTDDEQAGEQPRDSVADSSEDSAESPDDADVPEDDREVVVAHLVNRVVPASIDGDIDAPFEAVIDRDLTDYPVQVRVMIQALVRQANTLYQHSCAEARADIGYLTDSDMDAEKSALVKSLLADPTATVGDYLDAIVHRDGLITSIEDDLVQIADEFQSREDDWVEKKIAEILPELRRMFRESYPTTEEAEKQGVLDEAQPALDEADSRVDTAERHARSDVALRLRHQSTAGRHLSQIAGLTDVRAAMQDDLAHSIHSLLDAYEAQPVTAPSSDVDSDEDAGADDLVDSEADTTDPDAANDAAPEPGMAHRVDLSALIDSEHSDEPQQIDSDNDRHDLDYDEEDSDDLVDSFETADEEDEAETRQFDAVDSTGTTDAPDAGDANHPSSGDGQELGGDSSTPNWNEDTSETEPSPETDPATGEALDFEEDSETTDHEHNSTSTRKGIRRLIGRLGRNRRGRTER